MNTLHINDGASYDGKTILLSGGTGSFGRAMAERILASDVKQLRVFSRDTTKQERMRRRLGDDRVQYVVGDVRDKDAVRDAMRGVDHVFHAAALKQASHCEFSPEQAMDTNVRGSHTVFAEAERAGVASVVALSTDQAVYPVSVMGMTKALMEKLVRAHAGSAGSTLTIISCVRYGDVLSSTGSVLSQLLGQLRTGESLTVPGTNMTRFMMSTRECVHLAEQAFRYATQGDVFIQKTPATRIDDLVSVLCDLFGRAAVCHTAGIHHGEKNHETLATREELAFAENFGDHLRLRAKGAPVHCDLLLDEGEEEINRWTDYSSDNAARISRRELGAKLLELPELRTELIDAGRDLSVLDAKYGTDFAHLRLQLGEHEETPVTPRSRHGARAPLEHA